MASFYSNEGDVLTAYFLNQKLSHPSSDLPNNKDYANQPSVSLSYPNLLSGGSVSTGQDQIEAESQGNRGEMVFIPPTGILTGMQQIDRQPNAFPDMADPHMFSRDSSVHVHVSEPIQQYHGLSLSLGSQVPSLVQLPSDYTNQSLCSLLGSNMNSEIQIPQNNTVKNVQYLSFDLAGKSQDGVKYGASLNNFENLMGFKETGMMPSVYQAPEITATFSNSKYLKAAQDLLDEVVNVHKSIKQFEMGSSHCQDGSTGSDVKKEGINSEIHEPTTNASIDLSPSERHDLQNKMTKLLSMLEEVDRKYKQYFHQMQVVVSSFDMVAGRGAARPYTALALRTISRQFRALRDAIKKQIQFIQKSLGEQDSNLPGHGILSRLRHVDQQLRQQKALQQFGIMRQPWRPQRGLPESAVSVLRAWLFEHFLHPYPKDSEKLVLARQTGLTRSQVANWFINARVRLWKPMIEEMYKEEFTEAATGPNPSPEHAMGTGETSAFDDRDEEFQGSLMSAATDRVLSKELNELRPENGLDTYEPGGFHGSEANFGLSLLHEKRILDTHSDLLTDSMTGNQVSLALGLQRSERGSGPVGGEIQLNGNDASTSSTGVDKLEYYYVDPVNNQQRFANTHLLSDFVS